MSDVSQGPGWWQASDGKWYPPEQHPQYQAAQAAPPQPPQYQPAPVHVHVDKKRGCLWWVGLLTIAFVALIIVIAVIAAVGSNTSSKTSSTPGGPPPKAEYKVGDTAKTADVQVKVFGFKNPQPPADQFSRPSAGHHFVSVDVQITNATQDQQSFSSLIGFHLLDAQNRQYDEELTDAGLKPGAPEGELAAGQSIRGYVAFEVPNGTRGLKLRVQGSLTAAGAVFTLS
jgi:hypothetical protein